jgi:hypothetical protein
MVSSSAAVRSRTTSPGSATCCSLIRILLATTRRGLRFVGDRANARMSDLRRRAARWWSRRYGRARREGCAGCGGADRTGPRSLLPRSPGPALPRARAPAKATRRSVY